MKITCYSTNCVYHIIYNVDATIDTLTFFKWCHTISFSEPIIAYASCFLEYSLHTVCCYYIVQIPGFRYTPSKGALSAGMQSSIVHTLEGVVSRGIISEVDCMYVCMYVCMTCMYVRVYACTHICTISLDDTSYGCCPARSHWRYTALQVSQEQREQLLQKWPTLGWEAWWEIATCQAGSCRGRGEGGGERRRRKAWDNIQHKHKDY